MSDIADRLRRPAPPFGMEEYDPTWDVRQEAAAEIARLRAELDGYHEAAQYDATMAGPVFKGWNRSTLDRARRVTEANRADPSREPVDSR